MTTTPDSLYGVTQEQWRRWEGLRRTGLMNMSGAGDALGLTKDEFTAIIHHYTEMHEAWLASSEEWLGKFEEAMR